MDEKELQKSVQMRSVVHPVAIRKETQCGGNESAAFGSSVQLPTGLFSDTIIYLSQAALGFAKHGFAHDCKTLSILHLHSCLNLEYLRIASVST